LITGAVICEWLLLLALFTGACYVVARSPSPTLANCDSFCVDSRNSQQYCAHDVDTVSGTALTHAVSGAHKVLLLYFSVLMYSVLFYSFARSLI